MRAGAPTGISLLNKRIGASTGAALRRAARRHGRVSRPARPSVHDRRSAQPKRGWWPAASGSRRSATLAEALRARGVTTTLFYGARRAAELFYLDFFRDLGVELVLTTEDGSAGETRPRHRAARRALAARGADRAGHDLRLRTGRHARGDREDRGAFGRPCQVSVERIMGCGMGGCYSCVVPMRDDTGGFHHVRSCLAGPVLDARRLSGTEPWHRIWNRHQGS